MKETDADPFVDGFTFPESLRWHDDRLWLSDFCDRVVLSIGADGRARHELEAPGQPSGLGWLPDGRLLVRRPSALRVGREGLEPPTPCASCRCSSQLS